MFRVPEGQSLQWEVLQAEKDYIIQPNDLLQLDVYTNNGEKIIDANVESLSTANAQQSEQVVNYLVAPDGIVKFPLVNEIKLEGLTIRQAEEILQKEYARYYQQPFIVLSYVNKRVVVLGAPGGQIIPLTYSNMKLTEILAMAKGINNDARATNIRVLRGDKVYVADLSTFEGYRKHNIIMQPNDIVYVEPVRKPLTEALRDIGPIVSIVTGVTTLIVVIIGLK